MIEKLKQIGFLEPQWFLLLLVIPLLYYIYFKYLRNLTPGMFINVSIHEFEENTNKFSPIDYLFIIRSVAIFFVVIALASPQIITRTQVKTPSKETNIVFALDISKSMLIEDLKPNRLLALKDVLNKFVTMRSQDPIGIVLYAGESMNWCPLTKNYPLLLTKINTMEDNDLNDGTAIGSGLASAINLLNQSSQKNKVIVLLTDGENNAGNIDPLLAAEFAKRAKIKVYSIGIGTTGLADLPLIGLDGKKYYQKIYTTLNDTILKKIAEISGGQYFRATDAKALQDIYANINKLETKDTKLVTKLSYVSCYGWFVTIALILLFLEMLLKFTLLKTWPA